MWGTEFTANIFLLRVSIENETHLDDLIEETQDYIGELETDLHMLAVSSVSDIILEEWKEEPIRWMRMYVSEILDSLKEQYEFLQKLKMYKEYLYEQKD